ncbi:HtaA domain-containing protein [Georgenia sp. AZ-5]|uniref:HtaA domain-containing protein n=1 Tax=Georgenia sp. AZ-5 TaxID=3367526 RepID=UPI0037543A4D
MTAQDSEQQGDEQPEQLPPGMIWGVKRSFVRYIAQLMDGGHSATAGATLALGSLFHFEQADGSTYDPHTGTGALRFRGEVRLTGHFGMLSVTLAEPWVEFRDDGAVLTVVDHRSPDGGIRLDLATLEAGAPAEPQPGVHVWQNVPVTLTAAGQWLFNDQYPAGQQLDPLFIVHRR